jgi:hypothetical protein
LGLAGIALYFYASNLIVDVDWEAAFEQLSHEVDQLTPSQLLSVWSSSNIEDGLGEWKEQTLASNNTQGKILRILAYTLTGCGAIGIVLMAISFLGRNKNSSTCLGR